MLAKKLPANAITVLAIMANQSCLNRDIAISSLKAFGTRSRQQILPAREVALAGLIAGALPKTCAIETKNRGEICSLRGGTDIGY
jgi:hypothetical protein